MHRWITIAHAAETLSLTENAVRKLIERSPVDRGTHQVAPGIRARRLGSRWRVCLDDVWSRVEEPSKSRKGR